jgi:hypothetical protein
MTRKILTAALCAGLTVTLQAAKPVVKDSGSFYVYSDKGAKVNHFAPSGWRGDYGDIKLNDASTENPADGRTATKVTYLAKGAQGANWAGMFWQQPPNNWGDKPGGYNLEGMKRLTFWARGEKGGEKIAEFKTGGITGEYADSDSATIGPIELTKEWKKYTIELADKDLHHWIGGFCWSASRDDNPNGFNMHLDEIRFER